MKTLKTGTITTKVLPSPLGIDSSEWARLRAFEHSEPHSLLGAHPATWRGSAGVVIRAFHPEASGIECLLNGGEAIALELVREGGLFATFLEGARLPLAYRLGFHFAGGNTWERGEGIEKNVASFIEENNYSFHVLLDLESKVVEAFGVEGIPTKFVVDKERKIRFKSVGFGGDEDKMVQELSLMIDLLR